jgi:hypothetical protein
VAEGPALTFLRHRSASWEPRLRFAFARDLPRVRGLRLVAGAADHRPQLIARGTRAISCAPCPFRARHARFGILTIPER